MAKFSKACSKFCCAGWYYVGFVSMDPETHKRLKSVMSFYWIVIRLVNGSNTLPNDILES